MLGDNNKIEKFEKSIFEQTDKIIEKIEQEIKEIKSTQLSELEKQQCDRSKDILEIAEKEIIENMQRQISINQIKLNQTLLLERQAIIKQVFNNITYKLSQFVNTQEYEKYLISNIIQIIKKYNLKNCIIYITEQDQKYNKIISTQLSGLDIKYIIDNSQCNFIGGFKIKECTNNIFIDQTLDCLIENQSTYFNKICGLYID